MTGTDPDVRWMTYAEAARVLGVNPESVAKRMRRGNWARRLGNDGRPRVGVPVSVLPTVPAITGSVPPSVRVDVSDIAVNPEPSVPDTNQAESPKPDTAISVQALVAQLQAETARADRREADLIVASSRAASAEGEATALRDSVGYARAQAVTERAARDRAERDFAAQEVKEAALRAELAAERRNASQATEVDKAVRRELEHLKIERETLQNLGLLGRLAWLIRGNRV